MFQRSPLPDSSTGIPVLVTAFSSNHFVEALHMIQNVTSVMRRRYENVTMIVYDLGLTFLQRRMVINVLFLSGLDWTKLKLTSQD